MLVRQTAAPDGGLVTFFNYTTVSRSIATWDWLGRRIVASGPLDRLGFVFLWSRQSHWLAHHQKQNGVIERQSHTGIVEFQYGAHVAPGMILTPDIQYVIRPGATGHYRNAVMLGVSLQVGL